MGIPNEAILLVADSCIARLSSVAEMTANSLRNNRIDWVFANGRIFENSMTLQFMRTVLDDVLSCSTEDLTGERTELRQRCEAAIAKLDALNKELTATCFLNGPKRVPS